MNEDTIEGQARNFGGQVKEVAGKAIGDEQLAASGLSDQAAGIVQNGYGKLRDLARNRPFAFAALAGVVGLAFLNTLRGKK